MADWEWYVRSATQCAWRHVPERLAPGGPNTPANSRQARRVRSSPARLSQGDRDFRANAAEAMSRPPTLPAARPQRARSYLAGAAECLENGRADLAGETCGRRSISTRARRPCRSSPSWCAAPTAGGCGPRFGPPDLRCRVRRPDRRRRGTGSPGSSGSTTRRNLPCRSAHSRGKDSPYAIAAA